MFKKHKKIIVSVLMLVMAICTTSMSALAYNVGGSDISFVSGSANYATTIEMKSSLGVSNKTSGLNISCQTSAATTAFSGSVCEMSTVLSFSSSNNYGRFKVVANGTGSITWPQYARIYDYSNGSNGDILTTATVKNGFAYFDYTGTIPSVIKVAVYFDIPAGSPAIGYILRNISFEPISPLEQEEQKAEHQGNASVSEGTNAIENKGSGFVDSLNGLVSSMSYTGTQCSWTFPQVKMPAIKGVMEERVLIKEQPIDFTTWINAIPSPILLLIQSVLTMALIVYCFKELYGTISYVLTLRGGGTNE